MEKSYRIHIRHGEFELDIEGDRAFVESYLEALFLEEEAAAAVRVPEKKPRKKAAAKALPKKEGKRRGRPRKAREEAPSGDRKRKYGAIEIDKKALAAFTAGKVTKSSKERYHLYLQFLKSMGYEEAADAHVQACFQAEGLPVPPTGRQHFRTLAGQGFVRPGGRRGLWALTEEGAVFDFGGAKGRKKRPAGKRRAKAGRKGGKKTAEKAAPKKPRKVKRRRAAAPAKAPKARGARKPKAAPAAEPAAEPAPAPAEPKEQA